jgi:hypothetical protein
MASESVRFVVHLGQPWEHPRREFDHLEEAQAWQRETAPSWEISRVTATIVPVREVAR